MKILINYADNYYYRSQKLNSKTGLEVAGFDKVIEYSKKDIDKKFIKKNAMIINANRGAGYWLWKPYIILKTLEEVNDGDIIFYCDSGSYFIHNFEPIFKLLEKQDIVLFMMYNQYEKMWTKKDTFVYMDADKPEYTDTKQRLGGFQLVKKTPFSLDFYKKYLEYACDKRLITDAPNTCGLPNYPEFRDHRHDQSIFSVLSKKYNLEAYRDLSQWGNPYVDKFTNSNYPQIINLTRNKN